MSFIIIILSIIVIYILFYFADEFCNNVPINPLESLYKLNLNPIFRFVLCI